ncbi:hypothetical protein AVEN_137632-1 [Araneus ventricosus]|uniref:Uncharacterized protein n=1 Tax=Araneus ventricosus TaxID=182803 RepID=A0A4Y2V055_ARAVE|nr:hypothetical protein AVEN_86406-1 [Araneus ventricosus]GBO17137.1 hypothetical protein AVEN_137632-1 [Araneus ventricosus]
MSLAARVGVFAMQDPLLGSWQYFLLMLQITVATSLIEHLVSPRRLGRSIAYLVAVLWETLHFDHVGTSGSSDLAWDFRRVRAFLWPGSKMSVS